VNVLPVPTASSDTSPNRSHPPPSAKPPRTAQNRKPPRRAASVQLIEGLWEALVHCGRAHWGLGDGQPVIVALLGAPPLCPREPIHSELELNVPAADRITSYIQIDSQRLHRQQNRRELEPEARSLWPHLGSNRSFSPRFISHVSYPSTLRRCATFVLHTPTLGRDDSGTPALLVPLHRDYDSLVVSG
jgi:hypothetical protein